MIVEKVKYDIAYDLVPTYLNSLKDCIDSNVISRLTKYHIEALIRVALPDDQLALLPFRDPQASQSSE